MEVVRTKTVRPDMGVLDVKLKRAEKHISDLHIAIAAFHKEHRDFIGRKIDTNGNQVVYIKYVPEVPIMISAIVGDILQNLRSTLDHLAYRIVIANPMITRTSSSPVAGVKRNTWRPSVVE